MNSIEVFAGAGGLGMGLHSAGFRPLSVVERDPQCCRTLIHNIKGGCELVSGWNVENEDVQLKSFRKFDGDVALVSGGPPCQPFSQGGKHRAYNDKRDMFPQAIRAIREVRPKAFIFENVKGLDRENFRNYVEYIKLQMEHPEVLSSEGEDWAEHLGRLQQHHLSASRDGLNYRVALQVLNAADYGIPQRRERMFFVGFREDLGVKWRFPTPSHSRQALIRSQVSGEYWDKHSVSKIDLHGEVFPKLVEDSLSPWVTTRDALIDLPDVFDKEEPEALINHRYQPGARIYRGHTGSVLDLPAKTIKAGVHGVPGGENMLVRDDGSVRYFTIREIARLQTFPDDFVFSGSWSESMRQLGNAVPVNLAHIIGSSIYEHLGAIDAND